MTAKHVVVGPGEGETIQGPVGGPLTFRSAASAAAVR
jgi:hypothetical protein